MKKTFKISMDITIEDKNLTEGELDQAIEECFIENVNIMIRNGESIFDCFEVKEKKSKWQDNSFQFPRLLAEINATGVISPKSLKLLATEMDCKVEDVQDILKRATEVFDKIKSML